MYQMNHLRPTLLHQEGTDTFFHPEVRLGYPGVLPQVLQPGFHSEGLDETTGSGGIVEDTPEKCAVTPPQVPESMQGLQRQGGGKLCKLFEQSPFAGSNNLHKLNVPHGPHLKGPFLEGWHVVALR